jgi:hypothetical protein
LEDNTNNLTFSTGILSQTHPNKGFNQGKHFNRSQSNFSSNSQENEMKTISCSPKLPSTLTDPSIIEAIPKPKRFFVQKIQKSLELQRQIKILKIEKFIFTFTKRENVDKKLLRSWRKNLRNNKNKVQILTGENKTFWTNYMDCNLFPPFKYYENNENYEFKSFNSAYIIWCFTHEKSLEFYEYFIKEDYRKIISYYIGNFNIKENELRLLKEYLKNFGKIYYESLYSDKF